MELIRLYESASATSRGNLTVASDDFFWIHMFTTNWVCSTFAVQYIGNYLTVNSVNWQKFTELTVSWHGDNYVQCWLSQRSSAAPILYERQISSTILAWNTVCKNIWRKMLGLMVCLSTTKGNPYMDKLIVLQNLSFLSCTHCAGGHIKQINWNSQTSFLCTFQVQRAICKIYSEI